MATNPMQRKARNSFLLGMFVMLIITGLVIAFLVIQLTNMKKEENQEKLSMVTVYTLSQDVKSGQVITNDMYVEQEVNRNTVPSNATSDLSIIENYALKDKEGNDVTTEYASDGTATLYLQRDGEKLELHEEEAQPGTYYVGDDDDKEYIELTTVPLVAKVDLKANTVITTDLIAKGDDVTTDDTRKQEYNMLVLPTDLATGDYIDIRLLLPSGVDYIVVSKKEVTIPDIAGVPSTDTISVNLTEGETLLLSNAIVEAYKVTGAKLYVNRYTEPGMQQAAGTTYPVNQDVMALINSNPNIVEEARTALYARYNVDQRNNVVNSALSQAGDQADTNLQQKMEESITNSQTSRQDYLEGLTATTTTDTSATGTTNTTNTTN